MKKQRIGIFGGTFNPPHNGHITSAEHFITEMSLDKLLIIPAFIPPHKSYNSKTTTNKLLNEFRAEKNQAQLSPLEVYNNQEKENMGVSVVRNVPITPIAQNRNLSEYDKMKLIQSDAAYQKRSRR